MRETRMRNGRSERGGRRAGVALLVLAACTLAPAAAQAGDGRIELDDARALAGGITPADTAGYPVSLSQRGSYVLTSDLRPPAATTAILVTSPDVTIDLNGFALRGSFVCAPGACGATAGRGVEVSPSTTQNVAVSDGTVRGFGKDCIALGRLARVERLQVRDCGGDGINVGTASHVVANRIDAVARHGIALVDADAYYGDNLVAATALDVASGRSIVGGTALSGNVCADLGCSPRGTPRYFLSTGTFAGNAALVACGAGFHMASIYELLDTTGRAYDATRGTTAADSGTGPPAQIAGWVRMGGAASGASNCNGWTSNLAAQTGMRATLLTGISFGAAGTNVSPWQVGTTGTCDTAARVWCAED